MAELRDYQQWHLAHDDPTPGLSWRLAKVQGYLRQAISDPAGEVGLISLCAGHRRDVR